MLDALAEFAVAGGQFVGAAAGNFERDDRLIGEGADEFDLSFGERLHPCPRSIVPTTTPSRNSGRPMAVSVFSPA